MGERDGKTGGDRDIANVKKEITWYTIVAAVFCELISLPVLGVNIHVPYGLAIGVCVSVVNLNIISVSIDRAVQSGKEGPVFIGYILRIVLYGGAFLLAVKTSGVSGVGAAIGFLLPRITMYVRYGFLPWIRQKTGKEPPAIYETDTKSRIFVKEPWLVRYGKGKTYMTHRHYKKKRIFSETKER